MKRFRLWVWRTFLLPVRDDDSGDDSGMTALVLRQWLADRARARTRGL